MFWDERIDRIRNNKVKKKMGVTDTLVDTIEIKHLAWYDHIRRMSGKQSIMPTWKKENEKGPENHGMCKQK